jgi:hypothetical protein
VQPYGQFIFPAISSSVEAASDVHNIAACRRSWRREDHRKKRALATLTREGLVTDLGTGRYGHLKRWRRARELYHPGNSSQKVDLGHLVSLLG